MSERRVQFDFDITFANGGGIQGQDFRLDLDGDEIEDPALADYIVNDLRLLMVDRVEIHNKRYIEEPHKRAEDGSGPSTRLIDLSHPITEGMVTYPGLPGPVIGDHMSREDSRSHYEEGTEFHIGKIEMVANTGTYLDAPFHRYPDGTDLADLDVGDLFDIPASMVSTDAKSIGPEVLSDVEPRGMAILIHTGWSKNFGTDHYLGEHPHLTEAGAARLVDGGARLVGIDSANIDDTSSRARPAHSLLLAAGIPIVEHLTNLDQLVGAIKIRFTALPAPFVGVGTFPVRALARIDSRTGSPR